jgi:hypothetical protein
MNKLKINENNLLRTYFYTSPPYQGTKPSPEEKIKYQNFQKFLNFLIRLQKETFCRRIMR